MDKRVSAVAVAGYEVPALRAAVERHFEALGLWADLRPGMRVTLKPNLLSRHVPDHAVTTHPAVVEAVALALREHGIDDLTLADSPGGPYTGVLLQSVYNGCGMAEVAARTGMRLNEDTGARVLPCPDAALCRDFNIINPVAEADFVINLCKLKTHAMVGYSGAVKNLFGCIPGLQKPELHLRFPERERFCRMLVDLANLVNPGVTLMDAVVGMEGDGPAAGVPRRVGQLFAARNPHAMDLAVTAMIGMPPDAVLTVRHGIDAGLCPAGADGVEWLCGGRPADLVDFRHPASKSLSFTGHIPAVFRRPVEWVERVFLSPRPVIARKECIGCGKCAESCAPEAITIRERKAAINPDKCIRCYCCHELCPVKAVHIRRTGLLRL